MKRTVEGFAGTTLIAALLAITSVSLAQSVSPAMSDER